MKVINVRDGIPDPDALTECIDVLKRGAIICYPTETYYALGIDFWNEEAVQALYKVKQRSPEKELPLIASDIAMVGTVCDIGDSRVTPLARKFWPGPLTIVLPSHDRSTTFAIRVSSHPVARQIVKAFGSPVVSTSANISGEPAVATADQLPESFRHAIAILIDAGATRGGAPSTIVSLTDRPGKIIREGAIPATQIVSLL